jgi:pimeloyl-ACP methyl ester carboxylesterase
VSSASYHLFTKDRSARMSDGTPIAYTVRGTGASGLTVVLANGWSCPDAYWAHVVPHLEGQGHRVVLPDTRGHGDSGLPRKPGYRCRNLRPDDLSLERIARDLVELCDHEHVSSAVFMGHSMGVQTILEVYRQAPARVRGLVCVAGPYENPMRTFYGEPYMDSLYPLARFAIQAAPRFLLPAWRLMGYNHELGRRAAVMVRAAGPKVTTKALAPYISHLGSRDPLVMFMVIDSMRHHSAVDLLPHVGVPVLILAAEKDTFCPVACQERMHELTPGSELVVVPDATHCLPIEEPDIVNAEFDRFVGERLGVHPVSAAGGEEVAS